MFIYQRYSDNAARRVLPIVNTGVEDTQYPASNLIDDQPSIPAKLLTTVGSWVWQFLIPQTVEFVSFFHHNLHPSVDVRIQGNNMNVWTAPSLDVPFVIPPPHSNGFRPAPWLDLSNMGPSYLFWRLVIASDNPDLIAISEVWLGENLRVLEPGIRWEHKEEDWIPTITHRTIYGVRMSYGLNVEVRKLQGETPATEASLADIREWWWDARGMERPIVIVKDDSINEALLVTFAKDTLSADREFTDFTPLSLEFEEISRGLYL